MGQHPDYLKTSDQWLINVSPRDGYQEPFLHKSNGESSQCMTLNSCWGSSQPTFTTMEDSKSDAGQVAFDAPPQMSADVVLRTVDLENSSLWGCSICGI